MRPTALSTSALFEDHRSRLGWRWLEGRSAERCFTDAAVKHARSGADLAGYLNFLHPQRVQIIGAPEAAWLRGANAAEGAQRIASIGHLAPPAVVLCEALQAPPALLALCAQHGIPLLATEQSAAFVADVLRAYLSRYFADRCSVHGVLMEIMGLGVLIRGESGLGKSELGLELLMTRGAALIADDVVDLLRVDPLTIEGRCPELLQNMLEVRGVGLLDVRTIFGETTVTRRKRLALIVHLARRRAGMEVERLPASGEHMEDVLGVPIARVDIEVSVGRNLAVLVEAAVRNHILQLRGIDTYQSFIARQREAMDEASRLNTLM